ncbi:hypothetical protein CQA86_32585, partial [Klebsiella pneumoniae]
LHAPDLTGRSSPPGLHVFLPKNPLCMTAEEVADNCTPNHLHAPDLTGRSSPPGLHVFLPKNPLCMTAEEVA